MAVVRSPLVTRARVLGCLVVIATAGSACIFPSFEGFQGAPPDGGSDAASDGGGKEAGTNQDADAGGDGAATFACDTNGLRCLSGLQFCCGQLLADSICKAPPLGPIDCSEVLTCGDEVDCLGGDVCCYDKTTSQGTCAKDCTGPNKLVVCDPKKTPTSCRSGRTCTGVLEDTVPFCQ